MSWSEYQEWQVFDAMEPIGFKRGDYLAASLERAVLGAHVKEMPALSELILFSEERFAPADDDETEFSLGSWLGAAERRGLKVMKPVGED